MSHITKVHTTMIDLSTAVKAAKLLGLSCSFDKPYRSLNTKEIMPVVLNMPNWDIGLHLVDDKIELKADSYAYTEAQRAGNISKFLKKGEFLNEVRFSGILQQTYNIVNAITLAEKMGHKMTVTEPDENGTIHAEIIAN
jgi:hypothetical protein